MTTETETRPIPDALPTPVAVAGEYRAAIEALGNALQCQAGYAFRVTTFRQRLTELEARVTLAPEIDGKNEVVRRAQVAVALTGCDEWLQARDNADNAEHERDIAAGQAEVARERARYARTLLALLTAQTQATAPAPAPAAGRENTIAYQQGFDAACIGVLAERHRWELARCSHESWREALDRQGRAGTLDLVPWQHLSALDQQLHSAIAAGVVSDTVALVRRKRTEQQEQRP